MAITRVGEVSVGDLLEADLRIPDYQRAYSWGPRTGLQLLDDIAAAAGSGNGSGALPTSWAP